MRNAYFHNAIPEIATDFLSEGNVVARRARPNTESRSVDVALMTLRIAQRLDIRPPEAPAPGGLAYDEASDNLTFESPLISVLAGRRMHFLRGWRQFESCIKGFNSLGLLAEHVLNETQRLTGLDAPQLADAKRRYLSTRRQPDGTPVFAPGEVEALTVADLAALPVLDLALWRCFGHKTIVCSTSSNMGISLHQALRYMQASELTILGRRCRLLEPDEGHLIIWCPDEAADFMNPEKTRILREIEAERPALTRLETYINRQQRDPGALRDALLCGGYFFPTNPQSVEEVQNLLFVALNRIAEEREVSFATLLADEQIRETLASLSCEVVDDRVLVDVGIEGGISGLMVPYFIMVEEAVASDGTRAVSTWNQASIGAALAAAVLADQIIRDPDVLSEHTRSEFNALFPNISTMLDGRRFGRDIRSSVHGVFDIANLQSLAQLLGVVVERHLSGRGTAYVGLGSSSYSNGNRCFEILKSSMDGDGCFRGRASFHPATHTLNPFAQALIFGEDLYRAVSSAAFAAATPEARLALAQAHARKPEPAGAAAMAGYLLARLDDGTLSIVEIAHMLRLMGFTRPLLLEFVGLPPGTAGLNRFLQEAYEEGVYMGDLAKNILLMLDWALDTLAARATVDRAQSALQYQLHPLDSPEIDGGAPKVFIYLTGDNTAQPSADLVRQVMAFQEAHRVAIDAHLDAHYGALSQRKALDRLTLAHRAFATVLRGLRALEGGVERAMQSTLQREVEAQARRLAPPARQERA